MSRLFHCPYLDTEVLLSTTREQHIIEKHPKILPAYLPQMAETIADPDQIRRSDRDPKALLFCKWFSTIQTGRYFIAVVINETSPEQRWVITAYTARKITKRGEKVWPIKP